MKYQRGSALILALLMLTFLMVLGCALLTSVTLDVAIGENYRSETQLLYLAEAGIEDARQVLRDSTVPLSSLLAAAAGADGVLSASQDLDALLNNTDDIPLLNGGSRTAGKLLTDTSGRAAGRYFVFLRNDSADGWSSISDTNQIVTLLSVAVLGNSRKTLEVTLMKWKFPKLPAALVLDGSPVSFIPSSPGSGISGKDASAMGDDRNAFGVLTVADRASVLATIPDSEAIHYPGKSVLLPPPVDIVVLDGSAGSLLDPRLTTPSGIERIVDTIVANATEIMNPGWNGSATIGNIGSGEDYRVVAVNGDCELTSGTAYGLLLVRGHLKLSGNFHWDGLILVIGQGEIEWSQAGHGEISGNVFVARTRADDRSASNELGTLLQQRGPVSVNFSGVNLVNPGAVVLGLANQKFPFVPISIREN
jgi:Tfp pilus assembly protein PilX